jgi:nicotinic acid mononucleotide adenylyltransferase
MVEPAPRRKSDYASFTDRQAMVRQAIAGHAEFEEFSPRLEQLHSPRATHEQLIRRYGVSEFSIVLGGDTFCRISQWDEVDYARDAFRFVVGLRTEDDGEQVVELRDRFSLIAQLVSVGEPAISSSKVRAEFATSGQSSHVPAAVLQYVHEHKLYS